MRLHPYWPLAILICGLSAPALAHHGWSSYDSENPLTLNGTVVSAVFEWPHAEMVIDTQDRQWRVVLAPPTRTRNRGLPPERLSPGTQVTVVGYPHRMDEDEVRAERVMVDEATVELR